MSDRLYYYEISSIGHGHYGAFPCTVDLVAWRAVFSEKGTPPVRCYAGYYIDGKCPLSGLIRRAVWEGYLTDREGWPPRRIIALRRPIEPEDT